jgi:hypothetical protein
MSRSFHDLYRSHLSRHNYTDKTRPVLINSWEGNYFDVNETSMVALAGEAQELGMELFGMPFGLRQTFHANMVQYLMTVGSELSTPATTTHLALVIGRPIRPNSLMG